METITLFTENGRWLARHSDPRTRKLMGTDVLPCPFTSDHSAEEVRQHVQSHNPGQLVVVEA